MSLSLFVANQRQLLLGPAAKNKRPAIESLEITAAQPFAPGSSTATEESLGDTPPITSVRRGCKVFKSQAAKQQQYELASQIIKE